MNEVCKAYEQNIKFTVGRAGTGKSTELVKIAKSNALVLTPTHKAKEILIRKGVEHAQTIHSVLSLVPTIDQNVRRGRKIRKLRKVANVNLDEIDIVIIDEFSMINTKIADLLLSLLPEHCTVHFFGDAYQLPPIDGDPIFPLDYTDEENITVLTKQYRADNIDIVNSFERFARWIEDGSCKDLTLDNLPRITEKELAKRFNPQTDRILAYTNARVIELNSLIKTPSLAKDDDILINGIEAKVFEIGNDSGLPTIFPKIISKGRLNLDKINEVNDELTKYNGWELLKNEDELIVTIDGNYFNIFYDLEHYYNSKTLEKEVIDAQELVIRENNLDEKENLAKWCRINQNGMGVKRRARAWREYLSHNNYVFDLRYPYATTVHKAQGSEFDTVYIDQVNMKLAVRNGYIEQYARLMYVALSRAIKNIFIIE